MTTPLLPSVAVLLSVGLTGCSYFPVTHSWQMKGDGRSVTIEIDDWPVVGQHLYVAVPLDEIRKAEALLKEEDHVLLSGDQELTFNQHMARPSAADLRPYLIRAVTMGTPTYTRVRRNPKTNEVAVHRATWNGEIWYPFGSPRFGIWPVVIYLKQPPTRVYPTAIYGGDWIMLGALDADHRLIERE